MPIGAAKAWLAGQSEVPVADVDTIGDRITRDMAKAGVRNPRIGDGAAGPE